MSAAMSVVRNTSLLIRRSPMLSRMSLALVPDIHWTISVPNIGPLRIRLRRNRSMWLRPPLTLEEYPLAVLKSFVKPTDVVWDVGANIGLYARWLVTHLHARHVYSFEPMSDNLPELRHNLALGKVVDRVTVMPLALSDVDGEVEFQVDDVQSASGSVSAATGGKAAVARSAIGLPPKTEIVKSRTIDSLLASGDAAVPDVIKLDVEGAEALVLAGAKGLLSSHSPRLLIETHGAAVARRCLEILFDHGYSVAAFVPEEWSRQRHMRLEPAHLARISGNYDAHFIMASKNAADLPATLDLNNL